MTKPSCWVTCRRREWADSPKREDPWDRTQKGDLWAGEANFNHSPKKGGWTKGMKCVSSRTKGASVEQGWNLDIGGLGKPAWIAAQSYQGGLWNPFAKGEGVEWRDQAETLCERPEAVRGLVELPGLEGTGKLKPCNKGELELKLLSAQGVNRRRNAR